MNKLFLALITLSSLTLQAGHFGRSVGGSFVGGMAGSMFANAITQPRETIIVEKKVYTEDEEEARPSKRIRHKMNNLHDENETLQKQNRILQAKYDELAEKFEKLEKKIK